MQELIVQSRITPKKGLKNVVSRVSLVKEIASNIDKNIVLVCAPAGYGKTTLVRNFLENQDSPYAWFHVSSEVSNLYTFFLYIVHSLRTIKNDFGTNTLEAIESLKHSMNVTTDQKSIIPILTGTLANDFTNSFNDDIILVLDDLHEVQDEQWMVHAFDSLFENIPANLHIIITSREVPEFNIPRLVSKRNAYTIDAKKLQFKKDEIDELLTSIYSIQHTDGDIKHLEKQLNGWITGIHLVLQAYGKDFKKADLKSEDIFSFFANEIFLRLDKNLQDFLLDSCYLESFTADICDRILGIVNSREILEVLLAKNIFIESSQLTSTEGVLAAPSYSYHKMFKEFLVARLHREKSEQYVLGLVKKIYLFYIESGNNTSAVGFALFAKDYKTALEIIHKVFRKYFEDNQYELLWKWFEEIPDEVVDSSPYSDYCKGMLYRFFKSDAESAYKYLKKARDRVNQEEDAQLLIDSSIQMAEVLMRLGRHDEALKILDELSSISKSALNAAKMLYTQANIYWRLGPEYYDKIFEIIEKGIKICEENSVEGYVINFYSLSGLVNSHKGEIVKSIYYYELVLKQEKSVIAKMQILNNIIPLFAWTGNYSKAKQYLDEADELYNSFPSVHLRRFFLRTKSLLYFEAGDYESAIAILEQLIDIEVKNKVKRFLFWHYLTIAECYMLWSKLDMAKKFLEIAEENIDSKDDYEKLLLDLYNAVLRKKTNADKSVEETLLRVHDYFEEKGLTYAKTQAEFDIADYYYKNGLFDSCKKYLAQALGNAAQRQYISFLEQDYGGYRYLFDFAAANNIGKEFTKEILAGVLNKASLSWLSDECRIRISNTAQKLCDIYMNAFGGIKIMVRGNVIEEEKWIRKKSKLILAYLLLNQEMKFTKDKVMGIFFSDLSASSADNVFHQSITNIRNAVKEDGTSPEEKSGKPKSKTKETKSADKKQKAADTGPEYILYEDKVLRLNPNYYYKVDAVEFNELYHKIKSSETKSADKAAYAARALDLYKGELLAGQYDEWCEELRTNYANKFTDLCEEMITMFQEQNKYREVITYAERLLQADKLHEDAYVNLIEAYVKSGSFNSARTKFSQLLKVYDEEYGEKPPRSIMNKIQELLSSAKT